MEIPGDGYHSRIIRSKLEFRQKDVPTAALAFLNHTVSQAAVRRHASAYRDILYARLLGSLDEFVHKDIDKSLLERCADVGLVFLHEFRVESHLVPHEIEKGRLDSAETVIQPRDMRLRESKPVRIPFLSQPVYDRTTRITEPHHLLALVESLAHRIVYRGAQNLEVQR